MYEGKYYSPALKKITSRGYTRSGSSVDVAKAEAAERLARWKAYGALDTASHATLSAAKANKTYQASLWIGGRLPPWKAGRAAIAVALAKTKAPVLKAAKGHGLKVVWDDPDSPLILVSGSAAGLSALSRNTAVGRMSLALGGQPSTLGTPGDGQEKLDIGWEKLETDHGPITSEVSIVNWDRCMPHESVRNYQTTGDQMAYLPVDPVNYTLYGSAGHPDNCPSTYIDRIQHADRTTGIIAGRVDSGYTPARGFDSFLPDLATIKIATMQDLVPLTGQAHFERIKQVAQANHDVQSWEAGFAEIGHGPGYGHPANWHLFHDHYANLNPSLNIFSAGNQGDTSSTTSGWVEFKQRNALIVGGYYDLNVTPPQPTMFYHGLNDSYSSWLSPYVDGGHKDRRIPHVSASGTYVQSFDHLTRTPGAGGSGAYYRCDMPTDKPTVNARGTSFAAPQVAALGAYAMRQFNCYFPNDKQKAVQHSRATIMASSTLQVRYGPGRQYHPLHTGYAQYDEKKWAAGAGGIRADFLSDKMGPPCTTPGMPMPPELGIWDMEFFFPEGGPPPGTKEESKPMPTPPGEVTDLRCRFVIAWPPEPQCSGTSPNISCTEEKGYDMDLCIIRVGDQHVYGCAASWENNYEFLEVEILSGTVVALQVIPYQGIPNGTAKVALTYVCTWQ